MKVDVTFDGILRFRDVIKPFIVENEEGEQIRVRMADGGFEILYNEGTKVVGKVKPNASIT